VAAVERDDGQATAVAYWALAVLHNGLADCPAALEHARAAVRRDEPAIEPVEAAVRCGEPSEAAEALVALPRRTGPAVTDWARGVEAYCEALTAGDDARAEHRFLEAVQRLRACRVVLHPARAHLVFGQWLRWAARRRAACEQLRAARWRCFRRRGPRPSPRWLCRSCGRRVNTRGGRRRIPAGS
jgi:hypothetical protein